MQPFTEARRALTQPREMQFTNFGLCFRRHMHSKKFINLIIYYFPCIRRENTAKNVALKLKKSLLKRKRSNCASAIEMFIFLYPLEVQCVRKDTFRKGCIVQTVAAVINFALDSTLLGGLWSCFVIFECLKLPHVYAFIYQK